MSTRVSNQAMSSRPATNKETATHKHDSSKRVIGNTRSIRSSATRGGSQVSAVPGNSKETTILKRNYANRVGGNQKSSPGTCGIRLPKRSELSPVRILKHLRSKMAKSLCFASLRERHSPTTVSSSGRSKPSVIPVDSHRTEAIEDCIEFINSSSSLPRSNSVSANSF